LSSGGSTDFCSWLAGLRPVDMNTTRSWNIFSLLSWFSL
jgi:hypothetical protein